MDGLYFAEPKFLWGFALLAIPVLLLLTKAKAYWTTSFSSVIFLSDLTKKATTIIEWKRLLLLAVRLGILSLLALAFALPFSTGRGLFADPNARHRIFLIDRSYSMDYAGEDGSLFEQAKKEIKKILETGPSPRALYSLLAFDRHLQTVVAATGDQKAFVKALEELKVTQLASDFSILPAEIKKIGQDETGRAGELYLVSDFSLGEGQEAEPFQSLLLQESGPLNLRFIPVKPARYENFEIRDFLLPSRPYLPGVEEKIMVRYKNHGLSPDTEVTINLSLEEKLVASKKIRLGDQPEGRVPLEVIFPNPGELRISAESSADFLSADNVRYAVVPVRAPLQILLAADSMYDYPFQDPYYYLTQVLESYGSESRSRSWIELTKLQRNDLEDAELSGYDLAVIADIPDLEETLWTRLRYFVKTGGVLLLAPGNRWENPIREPKNQQLKLLGGSFGKPESLSSKEIRLDPVPYEHPLLSVFDRGKQGDLGRIRFSKIIPFFPNEDSAAPAILLWFNGQWPAFTESRLGDGKLYLWTSSLNADWNDFPKSPLYVPFMVEFLKYALLDWQIFDPKLVTGDALPFDAPAGKSLGQIQVKIPSGEQTTLYHDAKVKLKPFPALSPGFYEWSEISGVSVKRRLMACNVNTEESQIAYPPIRTENGGPVHPAQAQTNFQDNRLEKNYLYLSLFSGIFMMLFAEAWLANQVYKPSLI